MDMEVASEVAAEVAAEVAVAQKSRLHRLFCPPN